MRDNRKCITISLPTLTWSHCFVGNKENLGSVYFMEKCQVLAWSARLRGVGVGRSRDVFCV